MPAVAPLSGYIGLAGNETTRPVEAVRQSQTAVRFCLGRGPINLWLSPIRQPEESKMTKTRTIRVDFRPARNARTTRGSRRHTLSRCEATGLARFRDRHQARAGAKSLSSTSPHAVVDVFACPECRGWHVEEFAAHTLTPAPPAGEASAAFADSLDSRKRRYFLVDIENPTCGAKATATQAGMLWAVLKQQAPGVAPHDHVVIGASRSVTRRYRNVVGGSNVKWVVGANAPDAADKALLSAIDLRRVARQYDELVIVSGDHAFADLARRAKAAGMTVHVITAEHPESRSMLSRDLAQAADIRTVVRLRSRSQRAQTIQATRAMAAAWRRDMQPMAA